MLCVTFLSLCSEHCAFNYIVALIRYSVFKHCAFVIAPWRLRLVPLSIVLSSSRPGVMVGAFKHCAFTYIEALIRYSVFKHCAFVIAPWRLGLVPLSIALLLSRPGV
jgi:hypothetical protein